MKNLFLILFTLCCTFINAQFTVTENTNATQLAQQLAGTGVAISNATLVCPTSIPTGEAFSGTFSGSDPSLGISEGVLLTTGIVTTVNDLVGSTTFISDNTNFNNSNGDTDLDALLATLGESYNTNDACVLEFDIDVIGDTLRFNYAMGSEEYPGFVCGGVNDIFGFFISGPNPAGGNYTNQNVALIPGTTLPVSINTVNNGGSGIAATCYDGTYSNFMNPNTSPISSVPNIAYNEITAVFEAKAATVPCAQYHFKLAIADGGDWAFDSGVFLEAGSFSSTGVIVAASTILGAGFNTMVENCIDGEIEFILEDGVNLTTSPIAIPYSFSGTATHLVDFVQLPFEDTAYVQPGDSSTTIQLVTIPDAISEGVETIEINVEGECGAIIASTMDISDIIPFNVSPYDDSLCIGESINFEVTGAQTYSWSPTTFVANPNSGTTTITPTATTTYTVSYALGNCTDDTTFTIYVSNLTANSFSTNETCTDDNDGTAYITYSGGVGNVTYLWDDGNTDSARTDLQAGTYCVTISDEGGCDITLCEDITEPNLFLSIFTSPNTLCNNEDALLEVFHNLSQNATFSWSPANFVLDPSSGTTTNTTNISSLTTLTLTATDQGCTYTEQTTINLSTLEASINVTDESCSGESDGALEVVVTGENGQTFFFWDNFENTALISNLDTGIYCVDVIDSDCYFTLCEEVSSNTALSLNLSADDLILCNETSTNIYINSNVNNGTFTWSPAANFADVNATEQNTAINLQGNTTITVTGVNANNCIISEDIVISAKTLVVNPDYTDTTTGSGTTTDIGVTVASQSNLNDDISFTWTPSSFLASTSEENTSTTPTENIVYTITSEADGCTDVDSILVFVGIELEMPEAFSPNADGLNDVFKPVLVGADVLEFRIYDRWGKLIHDNINGWDGKFKQKDQELGVYNYFIKVSNGQEDVSKFGTFSLIR